MILSALTEKLCIIIQALITVLWSGKESGEWQCRSVFGSNQHP